MSTPPVNLHKKGEHVFNDIAGSLQNAFDAALNLRRASAFTLSGPHGPIQLSDLPSTAAGLTRILQDTILAEAREVVAPPTGAINDRNSQLYGQAKQNFEDNLCELVYSMASWIWKRKPRTRSSFLEFEASVEGLRDSRLAILGAKSAFGFLVDLAHDPDAEDGALSEKISDVELKRRKAIINAMHDHRSVLKEHGATLIDTFARELEVILERRIFTA